MIQNLTLLGLLQNIDNWKEGLAFTYDGTQFYKISATQFRSSDGRIYTKSIDF